MFRQTLVQLRIPPAVRAQPFLFGVSLSLLSFTLAGTAGGVLVLLLGQQGLTASAGAQLLPTPEPWLFLLAVIIIPAFETLTAQLIPIELLRRLRSSKTVAIVVSAGAFGVGHYVMGSVSHGITSFLSGLVFGYAYLAFSDQSWGRGFLCAWSAHAAHNFLFLYGVGKLLAGWFSASGA